MSQNNDDKPHSYTESAYKEGESSDQETECKEVDCKCQPGICLRSVREICATEYTEAIEKASSNANMITEKLYRFLRGNPDSTHIDFRDFFIKELNDISAPSEYQQEPMFTVEDMEKCFEMGCRFGRDMVNNPSNTEYVRGLYELRKQQLTRNP